MGTSSIQSAFGGAVLWGCAVLSALMVVAWLAMLARKAPQKLREVVKRRGWVFIAVMAGLMAVATELGSPTREDKDDENRARQQRAAVESIGNGLDGLERFSRMNSGDSPSDNSDNAGSTEGVHFAEVNDGGARSAADGESGEVDAGDLPVVRPITASDYAAGIVLSRIGMGENWDFSAPEGAEICTAWRDFGAAEDWFRTHFPTNRFPTGSAGESWSFRLGTNTVDAMTVFSCGMARPVATNAATFFAPFRTRLGVAPAANWSGLDVQDRPSQYWQCLTPSNTFVMTWQNVLLDRASDKPVSFQAEFRSDGCVEFRYDLSRLADGVVTNLVVGIMNGGEGRTFGALARNTTSLKWQWLDPTRANDPDPDNDGVCTEDEVLVYHTDPYVADTDMDGLSDGEEIMEIESDPLDPHSIDSRYPDGVAVIIGDVDPFSSPEGSTNTVWEHVFYTGTTNAPFAYPESSTESAVLKVTVSGAGSGELIVGDRIVPLLRCPDDAPTRSPSRGDDDDGRLGTSLLVQVERGGEVRLHLRGDDSLSVELDSDDFAFGMLPSWPFGALMGFVHFPNVEAETPCIHDFNARRKRISLPAEDGAEMLTCTWHAEDDGVLIENEPPRSALVTARFSARDTGGITYTLAHPLYLFGRTNHVQTVRFCPHSHEDGDPLGQTDDDPSWFSGDDGDSSEVGAEHEERWCCFWGTCCNGDGTCSCGCGGCAQCGSAVSVDADGCPEHHVSYEQCAPQHHADYTNSVWEAPSFIDVLKLHDSPEYDLVDLCCPDEYHRCCGCPDHWTNYVALAYRSCRLRVKDDAGRDFQRSEEACTVKVYGVLPSSAIADSTLAFVTNGAAYRTHNYTVLGVGFSKPGGPPLSLYNELSRTMGVPMTVTTNLNYALRLDMLTNVKLPFGNVHLSMVVPEGQFTVWVCDSRTGEYRRLLDTEGHSVINLPISLWRRLLGNCSDPNSSTTPIYITSSSRGSMTLRFGYWGLFEGTAIEDWCFQSVTSVNPPLLPDYDRDGMAGESDVDCHIRGDSFWYWQNEDTVKGGFIPDGGGDGIRNASDGVVNGPLDLVNFFPLAINVSELLDHWGGAVSCRLEDEDRQDGRFNFCFANVAWSRVGSIQTNAVTTAGGQPLIQATLQSLTSDGYTIPWLTLAGFSENSGVLIAEAVESYASLQIVFRHNNEIMYSYALPMMIRPVRDMYRFYTLRGAEEVAHGTFELPSPEWAIPLPGEKDQDIFFTHGFNVTYDGSWAWGDMLFKRFWLSGSRARFNMVTWAGNYNWTGDWANGLHYQQDAYQAQMTGDAMKRLIEREQPDPAKRILMTQSLGNMVACEALREGLTVAKYFMFDAAVASEAIDGSLQSTNSVGAAFNSYVPLAWRNYPHLSWAANWFRWFEADADDARGHMGWPDRFASALDNAGEVFNYYSTGDEVFHATPSIPWLLQGMSESTANYCWQKQETLKGSQFVAGTAHGGWGFHERLYYTHPATMSPVTSPYTYGEAANMIEDGSITNNPVFNRGYLPMLERDASDEEVFMVLAKYVPAVSSGVGGRQLERNVDENVDMNSLSDVNGIPRPNGWGRSSTDDANPWKHSDMKDIAYYYVFKLFEQLNVKGDLR